MEGCEYDELTLCTYVQWSNTYIYPVLPCIESIYWGIYEMYTLFPILGWTKIHREKIWHLFGLLFRIFNYRLSSLWFLFFNYKTNLHSSTPNCFISMFYRSDDQIFNTTLVDSKNFPILRSVDWLEPMWCGKVLIIVSCWVETR